MRRLARISDRWLDGALAAAVLVTFEWEILTSHHRHGSLGLNLVIVAVIALSTLWRRRAPLEFVCVVMGLSILLTTALTDVTKLIASVYVLLIPAYTVAADEEQTRALVGLAICLISASVLNAISGQNVASYLFVSGFVVAAWTVGRSLRARRLLNKELERKAQRIAAERESRERLVIADERTRIARELHALVAGSISAMVVQTEAAQYLLQQAPEQADEAMATVEDAGRQALSEMRRILGVLRHSDEAAELAPQPGVGQIHALIERARAHSRDIAFEVQGDPGPLPASIDLGVYRILEEALAVSGPGALDVGLRFGERDVELHVVSRGTVPPAWPTLAMRERCAVCDGQILAAGHSLSVQLPRVFEELVV